MWSVGCGGRACKAMVGAGRWDKNNFWPVFGKGEGKSTTSPLARGKHDGHHSPHSPAWTQALVLRSALLPGCSGPQLWEGMKGSCCPS